MDPLVLLFLILIVVVSGLIGILADNLGRKLGKQRLTIGNLRPKHTARLGTFLAGMVTSGVTILLVFVLSSDVRQWIVEGRHAIAVAKTLTQRNSVLEQSDRTMQSEITDLTGLKSKLGFTIDGQKKSLAKIRSQYNLAEKNYEQAVEREKIAQQKIADASKKLKLTASKLLVTSTKLRNASTQLSAVQQKLASLSLKFDYLRKDYTDQQDRDIKLAASNAALTSKLESLKQIESELQQQLDADKAAKVLAAQALEKATAELAAGQKALAEIKQQVSLEEARLKGYEQVTEATRKQPLIFARGEELARVEIRSNADLKTVQNAVVKLLREARIAATKRGAAPSPRFQNGGSAGFATINLADGSQVTPDEQEDAIIRRLVGEPSEVVLIAQSLLNSFRGEYVALEVNGYNNPLVFKRRQVVASTRLNGRLSRERLLAQLTEFMHDNVVKNALAAGMIPVEGSSGLLDVPTSTTLSLVEQLSAAGRVMRVQAVTTSDTHAADHLDLDFVLK